MVEYKVYFKKSVEKDFGTIPKRDLKKIFNASQCSPKIHALKVVKN